MHVNRGVEESVVVRHRDGRAGRAGRSEGEVSLLGGRMMTALSALIGASCMLLRAGACTCAPKAIWVEWGGSGEQGAVQRVLWMVFPVCSWLQRRIAGKTSKVKSKSEK